eukprot:SAG31_NODE_3901_length_3770_cov_4.494416_7_plen_123_part_00
MEPQAESLDKTLFPETSGNHAELPSDAGNEELQDALARLEETRSELLRRNQAHIRRDVTYIDDVQSAIWSVLRVTASGDRPVKPMLLARLCANKLAGDTAGQYHTSDLLRLQSWRRQSTVCS